MLAPFFVQEIWRTFGIASGIPDGTPNSPWIGDYSSIVPEYRYHDPGYSMVYMPQDNGNGILYNYKSLDG